MTRSSAVERSGNRKVGGSNPLVKLRLTNFIRGILRRFLQNRKGTENLDDADMPWDRGPIRN